MEIRDPTQGNLMTGNDQHLYWVYKTGNGDTYISDANSEIRHPDGSPLGENEEINDDLMKSDYQFNTKNK